MTSSNLDELRTRLERERDDLKARIRDLGITRDGGSHDVGVDEGFADSGAVSAERRELLTLHGSLQANLDDVEASLAKVEAGTYGICERCGEQINPARLEALPSARVCVRCASNA